MYFSPNNETVNPRAQVVLIGLSPGFTQMEIAYRKAKEGLLIGKSLQEVSEQVKAEASFAGSMRIHLLEMLDQLRLAELLEIPSIESLFAEHRALLHTTSMLRYPIFKRGQNYTGHQPAVLSSPWLTSFITHDLAEEVAYCRDAFFIPLGNCVSEAIRPLVNQGLLTQDQCLFGFPHPSGANGHRHKQFARHQEEFRHVLCNWFR